jgi:hypothetical protein
MLAEFGTGQVFWSMLWVFPFFIVIWMSILKELATLKDQGIVIEEVSAAAKTKILAS